ncbi:DUF4440 domain-containing protein [Pseudorhodoferax sp. Leaf274]|uniref:nuclear transport factor 2 family protein n=1 Tax=Pseudorhodoferax sp. Leaf274 TaxID=1736318 RepID=UPI0007032E60|nr:DUF4440 domain-containing protein [Pseudorhodoferax sp. Leaf274]KQP49685.1 hypothetical protein ASF44_03610 [Pseudorhodoferax sp. Leaf274]
MPTLLAELQALETELHHPGRPHARGRLEQLLHADFHEVGRSGRPYDRATVLDWLASQAVPPATVSHSFRLEYLAPGTALLHYRSVRQDGQGGPAEHTLRMSLWVETAAGWQLRYHQGTPAAPAPAPHP